jgi:tetratricopeptide (TPR) repeat protein
MAYTALDLPKQAVDDYDQALRLDPNLGIAYLNRGVLHCKARRLPEAEADLRKALEKGADPASAYYNLALVHVARDNRAAALEFAGKAKDLNPHHAKARELFDHLSDGNTKVITN